MNIAFVLPAIADYPIGGYKIAYEYANRLQKKGHQVMVYHVHNAISRKGFPKIRSY